MKPFQMNILLAIVVIAMSAFGYFTSSTPSPTAFIPAAFGLIFLALTPSFKQENKAVAHIVVLLTAILLFALIKPFMGALGRNDNAAAMRVGVMIITSIIAMAVYVNSFIQARKNRKANS